MNILGINCIAYDSSSCIFQDGKLIVAFEEERLNRKKYTDVFPKEGIKKCLELSGLQLNDVDYITLNWNPWIGTLRRGWNALRYAPRSLFGFGVPEGRGSGSKWLEILSLSLAFHRHFGISVFEVMKKIRYINHHLAHAASCYYVSGFENSAFLCIDGAGEWTATSLGVGHGNKLKVLKTVDYPHSVGYLYLALTQFLGFGLLGGEWKVMGLAPYGSDNFRREFSLIYKLLPDGDYRLDLRYFNYENPAAKNMYSAALVDLLGPAREPNTPIENRHMDIAHSLQKVTEEIGLHLARYLFEQTGNSNLCIAGGVGLNCVMNGRISRELPFKDIYILPAVNDAGGCIGGATYLYHHVLDHPLSFRLSHAYWGEEFNDEDVLLFAEERGCRVRKLDNPSLEAAKMIAIGKIIGWFQGRMEFGPRSLGNRSILADARDAAMKDRINKAVKHREYFRPFAPAILAEQADRCFEMTVKESPFMLMTFFVKQEWQSKIPAVTHVDGTARVQTVTREHNEKFWRLIQAFDQITGVPVVLNTSFNDSDEPIVSSPKDAINTFLKTEIDELIIGNLHVTRPSNEV